MLERLRGLWLNISQSLGFIPGLIVAFFAVLGIVLTEVDNTVDLTGVEVVFQGDGSAARTVLSVLAGSLITVAGLTFSITMVVLQLASSQFSPRILRTFFGDRITQVTIGTYVGTFVYSILVLRAVGAYGDTGFVPRLSVTAASLLGIGAVVLLIVYLHHISQMVQVSHVVAGVANATLRRMDALYPDPCGEPVDEPVEGLLAEWRREPAGRVMPRDPGFVRRVNLDSLMEDLGGVAERVVICVCPGDFADLDAPIAEVWPADTAERSGKLIRSAITVADERDLDQDVAFGLRQLTDTALRALSPGINDPMTAVTCIRYLRSVLSRLASRAPATRIRRSPDGSLVVIARRRTFEEHLGVLEQLSRYAEGDGWVVAELLAALEAIHRSADERGALGRARYVRELAGTIAGQALDEVANPRDRERVERLMAGFGSGARAAP